MRILPQLSRALRRTLVAVLTGHAVFLSLASTGHTTEGLLNQLLAPGPLIKGHMDLESDCLKCHDMGKGVPNSKCEDCHKEIAASVKAKTGFHGIQTKSCASCHVDHKGRAFDTMAIDREKFDHFAMTGYRLEGKHATVDCEKCHTDRRDEKSILPGSVRWIGQKSTCVSCHKKDDVHYFKKEWAAKDCNFCHGQKSWKTEVKFDHDTQTHYKLEGKHAETSCAACHLPDKSRPKASVYKWPHLKARQCLECHENVHKGRMKAQFTGPKCLTCHTMQGWKISDFPHERVTGYRITGAHAKLNCVDCHKQSETASKTSTKYYVWKGLQSTCSSCHGDPHRGHLSSKFQGRCETCHNDNTWKIEKFDHARITHYSLSGKHAEITCTKCHIQSAAVLAQGEAGLKSYHWIGLKTQCSSCHTDPHRNHLSRKFQGRCEECHDNNAWKIKTFDHAKITHYSLNGKHAEINCTQCHIQTPAVLAQGEAGRKSYHWMGLKAQCLSCHKDVHRFGAWRSKKFKSPNQCLECHDEKIWKPARFNHTDDTRFPIDGKHVGLKCEDCHVIKDKDKKPIRAVYHWNNLRQKNCALCHKNPHIGSPNPQFRLKRCDQCHVTAGWIILLNGKAFDHKTTRFPLTGKHLSAKCKDCHEIKGKPIYRWETAAQDFCISCHRNVHQSQFHGKFSEKNCSACHTTNDFTHRLSFNHNETSFPLRLKHEEAKCEKCHVPTGRLFASSKDIKDHEPIHKFLFPEIKGKGCVGCHKDVHRGEFGASCTECHNEASWKKTKDFHKNFTLNGIHKTLGCAECHKDGRRLEGMSQNCALCHQKDDVHNGTLPNCGECHKQLFWENPEFQHSLTQFPLRGIHRTLDCNTCHSRGIYRGTPSNCSDCHLSQAPLVTNPPVPAHVFPQMLNCAECHNQFQF